LGSGGKTQKKSPKKEVTKSKRSTEAVERGVSCSGKVNAGYKDLVCVKEQSKSYYKRDVTREDSLMKGDRKPVEFGGGRTLDL